MTQRAPSTYEPKGSLDINDSAPIIINELYFTLQNQPPPDTFNVEQIVEWLLQINLDKKSLEAFVRDSWTLRKDLMREGKTVEESDDWHFSLKIYFRMRECCLELSKLYSFPHLKVSLKIPPDLFDENPLNILALITGLRPASMQREEMQREVINKVASLIEVINKVWCFANKKPKHPIAPLVKAFIEAPPVKRITKEYDRTHQIAVVKTPLGSVKDINFVDAGEARLREFATPESITHVDNSQAVFDFAKEPDSILPSVMPLDVASPLGIEPKTRSGAVHHVLRIFDEALMALAPRETKADISFTLGDLIDYLYPDGKFHRTNQLPYIINALDVLHFYATVPFKQPVTGSIGKWRPVVVRNALAPNSKNDDRIFLDVRLPDDAKQGMLVEKHIMRILGKKSAPQHYAYKSSCGIWNKYGTINGKLIDPTKPVISRNSEGYLVDTNGNELIGSDGKRIKNPYQSDAIAQLEREDNPDRTKYPILLNSDLIKACHPSGHMKNRREALTRAKEHWTRLETAGIVKIERFRDGWRIMPSESHMKAYRAMKEAIKPSRRGD